MSSMFGQYLGLPIAAHAGRAEARKRRSPDLHDLPDDPAAPRDSPL